MLASRISARGSATMNAPQQSLRVQCRTPASITCSSSSSAPLSCRSQQHPSAAAPSALHALGQSFAGAALGAALGLSLLLAPQPAMAASSSLTNAMQETYSFVDADKDGRVSKEELSTFVNKAAKSTGEVPIKQLDFVQKLFDLNADGAVSTDEFNVCMALSAGVNEDEVDPDVFAAFDSNKDGKVDIKEWTSALGDFGPNGRQAQEYIFQRVDRVYAGTGKLDVEGFYTAIPQLRTAVLGF